MHACKIPELARRLIFDLVHRLFRVKLFRERRRKKTLFRFFYNGLFRVKLFRIRKKEYTRAA
jgi:hypothetical protein